MPFYTCDNFFVVIYFLLILTFDLEVDIPGSMAGNTFTTTRCIIAMFLVLSFLISVSGSIIAKDTNPVQLFLTFFRFSKIGFTTIAAHIISAYFPFCSQGSQGS